MFVAALQTEGSFSVLKKNRSENTEASVCFYDTIKKKEQQSIPILVLFLERKSCWLQTFPFTTWVLSLVAPMRDGPQGGDKRSAPHGPFRLNSKTGKNVRIKSPFEKAPNSFGWKEKLFCLFVSGARVQDRPPCHCGIVTTSKRRAFRQTQTTQSPVDCVVVVSRPQ